MYKNKVTIQVPKDKNKPASCKSKLDLYSIVFNEMFMYLCKMIINKCLQLLKRKLQESVDGRMRFKNIKLTLLTYLQLHNSGFYSACFKVILQAI